MRIRELPDLMDVAPAPRPVLRAREPRPSSVRPAPTFLLVAGLAVLALVDWRATLGVALVCVARDVQLRNTLRGVLPIRGR
ncbi:MAG: hypothetical protein OEU54_00430 [Gemmatimonadota bacterium]|nr:hypothetical protein [Gemmatimonadota bacterium]